MFLDRRRRTRCPIVARLACGRAWSGAPFAVQSRCQPFFEGDWQRAHDFNPVVERYVPAIARFIRQNEGGGGAPMFLVRYEDLVQDPADWLRRIFEFLGVPHEDAAVEYGKHKHIKKSFGDPVTSTSTTARHRLRTGPVDIQATLPARAHARIIDSLDPADIAARGTRSSSSRRSPRSTATARTPAPCPRCRPTGSSGSSCSP
jgi:hypothetical protein